MSLVPRILWSAIAACFAAPLGGFVAKLLLIDVIDIGNGNSERATIGVILIFLVGIVSWAVGFQVFFSYVFKPKQ